MNTGVGLFMTLEGRTGNEPLVARYTEWSENGTKKREAKILKYNKDGYRKEDFTDWHDNGQVSEQGQSWRRGHYNIYGGKLVSFYRNGQKRSKELWDYGKPVTIKVWETNGEKCPETKVAEGMGTYAWRDKYRGEIYVVHSYMDGLSHGPSIWYQDGEKKAVQNWVKGKRQGTEIKHGHDE
jgi:antitoxin component YwqK of YwqJK toxin-antitoxin module